MGGTQSRSDDLRLLTDELGQLLQQAEDGGLAPWEALAFRDAMGVPPSICEAGVPSLNPSTSESEKGLIVITKKMMATSPLALTKDVPSEAPPQPHHSSSRHGSPLNMEASFPTILPMLPMLPKSPPSPWGRMNLKQNEKKAESCQIEDTEDDDGLAYWEDSLVGTIFAIPEMVAAEAVTVADDESSAAPATPSPSKAALFCSLSPIISEAHQSTTPLGPSTPEQQSPRRPAPLGPATKELPMRQVWEARRAPPSNEVWSSIPAGAIPDGLSPNSKTPRRAVRILRNLCGHCGSLMAAAGRGMAVMGIAAGLASAWGCS